MPSHLHATLTEMFRHRPKLAVELISGVLGTPLPAHSATQLGSAEVVALRATEHRADAVVLLRDGPQTVGAVIVEVQLRRRAEKKWTWPEYVASVRRRWRCPAALLVVCTDDPTARWAAAPIELGNAGSVLRPAVLGPAAVPMITDLDVAQRCPELAVLSAIAHGEESLAVVDVLMEALAHVEIDHAVEYTALVLSAVSARVRAHLEDVMSAETFEYQTEYFRGAVSRGEAKGRAEGSAEGRAEYLIRTLERRGLDIPAAVRERINGCADVGQLDAWFERAFTAEAAEDVFS